jgi:large subunit ribosomal protein L25
VADASLAVEVRQDTGKGAARRLRLTGRIPAILYGHGSDPVSLTVDSTALDRLIKSSHAGLNTLIALEGPSEVSGKTVMIKDLQREAVRGGLIHADLHLTDVTERVVVNVPVHSTGIAVGTIDGGLVDHAHREVELSCLVSAIPDEIVVDITALDMGDSLHAGDLVLPAGVELKTDPDMTLLSIVAPAKLELDTPTAEGEEGEAEAAEGEEAAASAEGAADEKGDEKGEKAKD